MDGGAVMASLRLRRHAGIGCTVHSHGREIVHDAIIETVTREDDFRVQSEEPFVICYRASFQKGGEGIECAFFYSGER